MNVAAKEEMIIKLNDERFKIIRLLKDPAVADHNKRLHMKRLEKINKEIEELIK